MALIACIFFFRDQDMCHQFSRLNVNFAGAQIKIMYGNSSSACPVCGSDHGVQRKQCRRAVSADCTVTDISSDGSDIPDLRSAHLIHRFSKHRDIFLYYRIGSDVGKCCSRADVDIAGIHFYDPLKFFDVTDAYQRRPCQFSFPDLDQNVAAPGDDPGFRMLFQKCHSFFYGFRVVIILNIIHAALPPFRSVLPL